MRTWKVAGEGVKPCFEPEATREAIFHGCKIARNDPDGRLFPGEIGAFFPGGVLFCKSSHFFGRSPCKIVQFGAVFRQLVEFPGLFVFRNQLPAVYARCLALVMSPVKFPLGLPLFRVALQQQVEMTGPRRVAFPPELSDLLRRPPEGLASNQ